LAALSSTFSGAGLHAGQEHCERSISLAQSAQYRALHVPHDTTSTRSASSAARQAAQLLKGCSAILSARRHDQNMHDGLADCTRPVAEKHVRGQAKEVAPASARNETPMDGLPQLPACKILAPGRCTPENC